MFKNSLEYKICELSTKIKQIDKERINFRKQYLQSIHPEDLRHLRNHFQTHATTTEVSKVQPFKSCHSVNVRVKSSSKDAADECGFIEL